MKKTKIVATLSSARCSQGFIRELYESGMNVVRINTAHQPLEDAGKLVEAVRSVSGRIAIMVDTKGPEIRTGTLEEPLEVAAGQRVLLSGSGCPGCVPVTRVSIAEEVPTGSRVMIDDGAVALIVREKSGNALVCEALNPGHINSRKSVNIPGVHIDLPPLTPRDIAFIEFAAERKLDFIAHSFVRSRADVEAVQGELNRLKSPIKVIAKIENSSGVENIDEILDAAYGVMVARGDLAIEMPFEKVPGIQKMLVDRCIRKRKPVIIATQMLHSMIEEPRPTRAEVNDVASAIYDQADAMMLSGETAIGAYPVEAVKAMAAIAAEVEMNKASMNDIPVEVINNDISAFLIKAAVEASVELDVKAIVADTTSGRTIRSLAAYRGSRVIYAQCYSRETARHLALSYGVRAMYMEPRSRSHEFVGDALASLAARGKFTREDRVVVVAGNFGRSRGVSFVEIGTVENLSEGPF